ncbi:MAG: radical SAM protein, partial [Candidatus Omnitrophota bacterium]
MAKKRYKYIYGPVPSWRLGRSLGVDPISAEVKICSFDCVYCQLGKTKMLTGRRKNFVPVSKIVQEIRSLPTVKIDYITFSGAGEPTLAKNLGEMIKTVKSIRKEPVAVLTNSSLMHRKDVRKDLSHADLVVAKLDASSEKTFKEINRPLKGITLQKVIDGIKKFSAGYAGKLALQIMFIKENEKFAGEIAQLAKKIDADEIQLNTPLRP